MTTRFAQVAGEQAIVAAIGLPEDVEDVAEERNGADEHADAEVGGHARERDVRHAANPGGEWDDERGDASQHVADAGN